FIYDLLSSKIEKKIKFGGGGDYEGITLNGSTAYIVESNGTITEVKNFQQPQFEVSIIETGLSAKQNIESIFMDSQQNRILLAVKDKGIKKSSKGIYEYNLKNGKFRHQPVFRIELQDKIFSKIKEKKLSKVMSPSDLAIHPESGKIYILDGKDPKILIMSSNGDAEKIITLNEDDFNQPEGITFSPSGKMYISNEGTPANILEIKLKETN
ncbi:SdiA-regulated domain-containing protein, partial [Autumnicola edwardsiae]